MDEELRKEIRQAVRDGIEEALTKYGIETSDHTSMQADMIYLRKSRLGSDEVLKWVRRSALTIIVTGTIAAFWQGFKHMIQGG